MTLTPPTSSRVSRFTLHTMSTDQEEFIDYKMSECLLTVTPKHIRTAQLIKPTTFPLFGELPSELRALIWAFCLDPQRIVRVLANGEEREICPYEDYEGGDEHVVAMQEIDRVLSNDMDDWDNVRKRESTDGFQQLESFGFTSSKARPAFPTPDEVEVLIDRRMTRNTIAKVRPRDPVPVALHVCRESRALMLSWGFELAFSTYERPATTWFNFKTDILYLEAIDILPPHPSEFKILDGGSSRMGQCPPRDLARVRKLAIMMEHYLSPEYFKSAAHEIVQQFGCLTELLFVRYDWHTPYGDEQTTARTGRGPCVAIDIALEEHWGHDFWFFRAYHNYVCYNEPWPRLPDAAEDFERWLREQKELVATRCVEKQTAKPSWSIPSVRFVGLVTESEVQNFYESRQSFRQYINDRYWGVLNGLKQREVELPYSGQDSQICYTHHPDLPPKLRDLRAAKEAICPEYSDPSLDQAQCWGEELSDYQRAMAEMVS